MQKGAWRDGLWLIAIIGLLLIEPNYNSAVAEEMSHEEEQSKAEVLWEFDPYYTNVSANIPLTNQPIPTINSASEAVIYRELVRDSLVPRFMLLEVSAYPLPLLGTYLKRRTPELYEKGRIGNSSINVFESVTAGFQEPWAVSAFFGNIAKLVRPGDDRIGSNMGYTGYLVSAGAKHIKNNLLIDDIWHELEWKIKGKREYPDEKISWSFRFGGKFHRNPDVADVYYLGIFRSNLDINAPVLRWLQNSTVDMKIHFALKNSKPVREELIVGKKFPVREKGYAPTLDVGLVWESPDEYSGQLRDCPGNTLTLVVRPSLQF